MGTVIRLAIAALIVHGAWRTGAAYWRHYEFRDEVQATAQFAGGLAERDLHARVVKIAADRGIPLPADQIVVRRDGGHLIVEGSYVDRIEILPMYFRPWGFDLAVDVLTIR
jgi:hypothetical protein